MQSNIEQEEIQCNQLISKMKSLDSLSDEDQGNFLSGFEGEEYPVDLLQSECAYENVVGGG
jgi:hypothetical protein